MKTHLAYITIIAVLSFFAFKKGKEVESLPESPSVTQSDSGIFYAYIAPNDQEVHIVNEYQPELEYKEINNIVYPFIKGTEKMLVALNTSHSAKQWIWEVYGQGVLKGYDLESLPVSRTDILPQEYRLAINEHNKVHPLGKNHVGQAMVRALFRKDQYTLIYMDRPPGIDFQKF